MNFDPQAWDVIKLLLSFAGALLIGWIAVGWALRRFQREKSWERRFSTYVDAITAMGEMRLIVGLMIDEIEDDRSADEKIRKERWARYGVAKRQLEQVEAVSILLFPPHIAKLISDLNENLARQTSVACGLYPAMNNEYSLLDDAIHDLNQEARSSLGLDPRWRWKRKLGIGSPNQQIKKPVPPLASPQASQAPAAQALRSEPSD